MRTHTWVSMWFWYRWNLWTEGHRWLYIHHTSSLWTLPHCSEGKCVGSIHNMCKEDGFDAFWIISGRMFGLETKNKMLDDIHWSQSTKDPSQLQIWSPQSAIKEKSQVNDLQTIRKKCQWLPGIEKWAILASPNPENTSLLPSRNKNHYCHLERRATIVI